MEFNFENPDNNNPTSPEDSKQSSSKKVIVLLIILALIIGIGVYYFLFSSGNSSNTEMAVGEPATINDAINNPSVSPTGETIPNTSTSLSGNNSLNSDRDVISGITVGGLFIPYGLDEKAIKFLQQLKSQGQFPIVVDESTLGRVNPF